MIKTINDGKEPTKGSKYSAAIDLYANTDVVIGAGETVIVPLGVCIDKNEFLKCMGRDTRSYIKYVDEFMKSHYLQLEPRSSLRAKGLQAGTGIIDLDYEDEIKIILHNPITLQSVMNMVKEFLVTHVPSRIAISKDVPLRRKLTIKKGDRIAQILLKEHKGYLMGIESEEERNGGFGSTGGYHE